MNFNAFDNDDDDSGLNGVHVGIVTNNQDPDGMGRVKLSFPWRDADDESNWARIATTMARDGQGTYFLPEVDDEVLVAFEGGDIHSPYVLGGLWSGNASPPVGDDADNDERKIVTRSGHGVLFNDSDDQASVVIETAGGHTITLDDGKESLSIVDSSGSNSITFSDGEIDIAAQQKISLSAPEIDVSGDQGVSVSGAQISLDADGQGSFTSSGKMEVSSQGMLDVKATGMMTVQSSAILTIKGSLIQLN